MRSRRWVNVALIAVILVGAVVAYLVIRPADAPIEATGTLRTATVATDTVTTTVSAQGSIEPATTKTVAFALAGEVATVDVVVGDLVTDGQELASITSDAADDAVTQATKAVTQAERAVTQAQTQVTSAKQARTAARLSVSAAEQDVDTAASGLTTAKKALNSAKKAVKATTTATATKTTATKTTAAITAGGTDPTGGGGGATGPGGSGSSGTGQGDTGGSTPAATSTPTPTSSASASPKDAVEAAETAVAQAKASVSQSASALSNAESQKTSADGQVTSAQASLADAQDTLAEARDALAEAEEDAADLSLVAPFAGVVTEVGIAVGDDVTDGTGASSPASSGSGASGMTGSADTGTSGGITVASLETYHVSGSFAEADAASLAVGQPASVEFPAVPDAAAEGKVVWISPLGSSSNSVVTYEATVELDELPELIRLSQTATITVVTAEAANVLTLPSNAVSALSTTEGTVEVLADPTGASAETTTATVGLGLQGDSTIEITSGLEEGDAVLISMDTSTGLTSSETSGQFRMITGGAGGGGFPAGGGGFPGGGGGFPGGGMP